MRLTLTVNGTGHHLDVADDRRLLDVLREDLGLTGSKEGCGEGECGSCAVLVDGEARLACLTLAAQVDGCRVTTVEGLGSPESLHPVQAAFARRGAIQCGYCTPGMVIASVALLSENPAPTPEEIREGLSGNLCRCTGYQVIVEAVDDAAQELRKARS